MSVIPKRGLILDLELERIRNELNQFKDEKIEQEKQKNEEFTMAQQLLVLYYLDFLKGIDLSLKVKSKLLSKILNRSMDNIKKNIPYIDSTKISHSKIKNITNLKVVWKLFNDLSMLEVADKVKVELNKIKEI